MPHGSAGSQSAMSQPRHGFAAFVIAARPQPAAALRNVPFPVELDRLAEGTRLKDHLRYGKWQNGRIAAGHRTQFQRNMLTGQALAIAARYFGGALLLAAIPTNLYFVYLLRRPFFHLNLRIILANFSIALICASITQILGITIYIVVANPQESVVWSQVTAWSVMINFAALAVIMNATFLMALERLVATIFFRIYEKVRFWIIPVILCVLVWILNALFGNILIATINTQSVVRKCRERLSLSHKDWTEKQIDDELTREMKSQGMQDFNVNDMENQDTVFWILLFFLVVNFIGVVMFLVIYLFNRRNWKRDLQRRLSHRYQIMENIRTSKQLLKVLFADFIITAFFFTSQYYSTVAKEITDPLYIILTVLFSPLLGIAALMLPILFLTTHSKLRQVVRQHLKRCCFWRSKRVVQRVSRRESIAAAAKADANVYFTQLQNSWK